MRKLEENIKGNSSQSSLLYQREKNQANKANNNPDEKSTNTSVDEFTNTGVVKSTETPVQKKTDISVEKSMETTLKGLYQIFKNSTYFQRIKTPDVKSTEKRTIKSKTTEADNLPDTSCEYPGNGWFYWYEF